MVAALERSSLVRIWSTQMKKPLLALAVLGAAALAIPAVLAQSNQTSTSKNPASTPAKEKTAAEKKAERRAEAARQAEQDKAAGVKRPQQEEEEEKP